MTAAVSASVEVDIGMGAATRSQPAGAFKVEVPAFFDLPEIVALFDRAFHGKDGDHDHFGIDPEEMRVYMRDHLTETGYNGIETWLLFWVVLQDQEFCGFIIGSYSPWPMCPNGCLLHIHVDKSGVSDTLITKTFGWAYGRGLRTISITNGSGISDKVYRRWFRRYGKATVRGTLMNIDLEEGPNGRR